MYNHRRLQDFTASRAWVWLKVGVAKKVGVVMTTPTCHAFECKPVKASFAAFSENIQLKKALHYLTKSHLAIVVFKRRKFSTLKTFFCTGYQ